MKAKIVKTILAIILVVITLLNTASFGVPRTLSAKETTVNDGATENEDQKEENGNAEMKIYFYPLEKNAMGDSCIITIGNVEILIDAGAKGGGAVSDVKTKMQSVISADGKWDYIIVTHADDDHISGIVKTVFPMFTSGEYKLGTLIDFDITEDESVQFEGKDQLFDSKTYEEYKPLRKSIIETGTQYFPSSKCYWDEGKAVSQRKVFNLGDTGATLKILYNYYYDHGYKEGGKASATNRNILSVCSLVEYGEHKMLFAGDIEEYDTTRTNMARTYAESYLVQYNKEALSGGVTLYKAAHHGSNSSSSQELLEAICPEYVAITCRAGDNQFNLPSQEVTDRLLMYTDKIYITSKLDTSSEKETPENDVGTENEEQKKETPENDVGTENKEQEKATPQEYYGEITFTTDGNNFTAETESENDDFGNPLPITQTSWFKENRNNVCSVYTFYLESNKERNCTLVKSGSTDILIDCGAYLKSSSSFVQKVLNHCTDGIIEYAIISTAESESLSGFLGENGLFASVKIENLIEFSNTGYDENGTHLKKYQSAKEKYGINAVSAKDVVDDVIIVGDFTIDILDSKFYDAEGEHSENDYSVCTLITFGHEKMLFTGDLTNVEEGEEYLIENNNNLEDITFFRAANYGGPNSNSGEFLKQIAPKFVVIDSNVGMKLAKKDETHPDRETLNRFLIMTKRMDDINVYLTSAFCQNKENPQNGEFGADLVFLIKKKKTSDTTYNTTYDIIQLAYPNDKNIKVVTVGQTMWYEEMNN